MTGKGTDLGIAAGLVGITLVMGLLYHPALPIGVDLDLWSLNALNLSIGGDTVVPPGYPALGALLIWIVEDHLLATSMISAAAMSLVPAGSWLLARYLGADRIAAGLAAVAVLGTPALIASGQQITPDPLTALTLLGMAAATARFVRQPDWRSMGLLCAVTALAYLTREHGLVAAVLALGVVAWAPGRLRTRAARVGLLIAAVILAPVLAGHHPAPPTLTPWTARFELVIVDALGSTPSWMSKPEATGMENSTLSLLLHTVVSTPASWVWVALGIAAAVRARGAALGAVVVGVLPATPALLIFSQPRHVLVVLPVAMAVAVTALTGRIRRAGLGAGAALVVAGIALGWGPTQERITRLSRHSTALRLIGLELCATVPPDTLWEGNMRAFTWCPLPHNDFDLPMTGAMWNTIYAGDPPPSDDWVQLPLEADLFRIYRLRWSGSQPACAGSTLPADLHYINVSRRQIWLEPPCEIRPPLGAAGEQPVPQKRKPLLPTDPQ